MSTADTPQQGSDAGPGSATGSGSARGSGRAWRLGILADPEVAPAELGNHLGNVLPDACSKLTGDGERWDVTVEHERLPAGHDESPAMVRRALAWKRDQQADLVLCVTDLPLRAGRQPVAAELLDRQGVAVVSLPAFGAMALQRRSRRVVLHLVATMLSSGAGGREVAAGVEPASVPLPRQFHRKEGSGVAGAGVDTRILTSRGRLRLLVGMVRDNRPWRLAAGLTGALVAAFAISAFYLVSTTAWELGNTLGPGRLSIATVLSTGALVAWLILRHQLWESPSRADLARERDELVLYNASTVLTLIIGVVCLYVALFVVILGAAFLLVDSGVLANYAGSPATLGTYANLAWFTSSVAALGGALGSGFDSDRSVRAAAYSYRERERRAQWSEQEDEAAEDDPEDVGSEDSASEDSAPEDSAPEDSAPEDSAPEDSAPEEVAEGDASGGDGPDSAATKGRALQSSRARQRSERDGADRGDMARSETKPDGTGHGETGHGETGHGETGHGEANQDKPERGAHHEAERPAPAGSYESEPARLHRSPAEDSRD